MSNSGEPQGDIIDRANERAQTFTDDGIADVRRRLADQATQPSATHCHTCGADIPEARRVALPGVSLCVACASAAEHFQRLGGRS